jgi:chemotaxis protein MotB
VSVHERRHNENAGSMRWLLTYADMITLLMTFFVILYAFSKTDVAKYEEIAASLRAALNGAPLDRGLPTTANNALVKLAPIPAPSAQLGTSAQDQLIVMAQEIESVLRSDRSAAVVVASPTQIDIRFQGDTVYFASASADLRPAFRRLLSDLAPILKQTHDEIRVEGFTNDLPLHSLKYPTAWELSAARAVNVVRYLSEVCGVPPHQLEADAFGQWHPRYPNDSALNLARNRSVDIVITDYPPPGLDEGGPDIAPGGPASVP